MTAKDSRLISHRLAHDIQFYDRHGTFANREYRKMIESSLRKLVIEAPHGQRKAGATRKS